MTDSGREQDDRKEVPQVMGLSGSYTELAIGGRILYVEVTSNRAPQLQWTSIVWVAKDWDTTRPKMQSKIRLKNVHILSLVTSEEDGTRREALVCSL